MKNLNSNNYGTIVNNNFARAEKFTESDLIYTLYVNNQESGTINIPKDLFLKNVSYNSDTKINKVNEVINLLKTGGTA